MKVVFDGFISTFKSPVKSTTVDHGKDFSRYNDLQDKYDLDIYFCHAYSPWKGETNENFN